MLLGVLLLWISSIPAVGIFLSRPLLATDTDWDIADLDGARAIVVAMAGYFPTEKRFFPGGQSLSRGDYGAWLQRLLEAAPSILKRQRNRRCFENSSVWKKNPS